MRNADEAVKAKVRAGLADVPAAMTRRKVSQMLRPAKVYALKAFPETGPKHRETKARAIARLHELVEEAVKHLEENGCHVYRARTSAEAVAYALQVIQPGTLAVKSKSNAAKETGVLEALAARNVQVIETDMGDRICQIGNIPASHPLGPAIHVPVAKVAELFSREADKVVPEDPNEIVKVARGLIRDAFLKADYGITGANAIAADTGSVVLTENEGNVRLVSNLPPVHVVFAGIEKIVPTLEDAIHVCHTAALYGTGVSTGGYINIISGPGEDSLDGPREMHVILLEEGRWEALQGGFSESLACINCGACLNVCPVYGEIGEQYGYKYFGGIGMIHTALRNGLEKATANGLSLCLGCQQCVDACPGKIHTPQMIQKLRHHSLKEGGLKREKEIILRYMADKQAKGWSLGRKVQFLGLRKDEKGKGYHLRFPLLGVDPNRLLPALAKETALELLPEVSRRYQHEAAGSNSKSTFEAHSNTKVAYFVGCLNNHVFPEIAKSSHRVLEHQGVEVFVPKEQTCCGYPMQTAGDWEMAKTVARKNLKAFEDYPADYVIVDCPTCGTSLRGYAEILAADQTWKEKAQSFSSKVRDIFEFLDLAKWTAPQGEVLGKAAYHQPCHLKHLGLNQAVEMLASIPGLEVSAEGTGDACCGFGGLTSLEHYDLTAAIASRKVEATPADREIIATACPGCMVHLADGFHRQSREVSVKHVIELVAESYTREEGECR